MYIRFQATSRLGRRTRRLGPSVVSVNIHDPQNRRVFVDRSPAPTDDEDDEGCLDGKGGGVFSTMRTMMVTTTCSGATRVPHDRVSDSRELVRALL